MNDRTNLTPTPEVRIDEQWVGERDVKPDPSDAKGTMDYWDSRRAREREALDADGVRDRVTIDPETGCAMISAADFRKHIKLDADGQLPDSDAIIDAATKNTDSIEKMAEHFRALDKQFAVPKLTFRQRVSRFVRKMLKG